MNFPSLRSPLVAALAAAVGLALAGGGAALAVGKSSSKSSKSNGSTSAQTGTTSTDGTTQRDCPGFGHRRGLGLPGAPPLDAAASYLGLTTQQVWSRLMNGQSLADIAKAQGKSVSGLEDAMVNAVADRLQKAVDAGTITAQQRTEILSEIRSHVGELVNRTPPGPGARPRFGGAPPMWGDGDGDRWRGNGPDRDGSSGNASYGPAAAGAWA